MATVDDLAAVVADLSAVGLVARAGFSEADEDMSGFITAQELARAMKLLLSSGLVGYVPLSTARYVLQQMHTHTQSSR